MRATLQSETRVAVYFQRRGLSWVWSLKQAPKVGPRISSPAPCRRLPRLRRQPWASLHTEHRLRLRAHHSSEASGEWLPRQRAQSLLLFRAVSGPRDLGPKH